MASPSGSAAISEPVPIFKLAHRYLVYDVNVVTYLRREHNISGVLVGTLPLAPQQNVFSGLPLELMPEEAILLVEKKVAYVVDDVPEHRRAFLANGLSAEERKAFQAALRKQGQTAAQEVSKRSDDKKKAALQRLGTENWNDIPDDMFSSGPRKGKKSGRAARPEAKTESETSNIDETLFGPPSDSTEAKSVASKAPSVASGAQAEAFAVTPTTSHPPLSASAAPGEHNGELLPPVPTAYPLYRHLHKEGYFLSPGLRFGCQYMAYPGDPLRFHSHFLCNGIDWEQEFDLLDLVGGGRLGTGVKKGFLLGGEEPKSSASADHDVPSDNVRAFCIEWGGM